MSAPRLLRIIRRRGGVARGHWVLRALDEPGEAWRLSVNLHGRDFESETGCGYANGVAALVRRLEAERDASIAEFESVIRTLRANVETFVPGFRPEFARRRLGQAIAAAKRNADGWVANYERLDDTLAEYGWPRRSAFAAVSLALNGTAIG